MVPRSGSCRLAAVPRRILGLRTRRLLLGLPRALGMGAVPLRALELGRGLRLVLGAGTGLLGRLGRLVLGIDSRRMGRDGLLGTPLQRSWDLLRLLRPLHLDVRGLRAHRPPELQPPRGARRRHRRRHPPRQGRHAATARLSEASGVLTRGAGQGDAHGGERRRGPDAARRPDLSSIPDDERRRAADTRAIGPGA